MSCLIFMTTCQSLTGNRALPNRQTFAIKTVHGLTPDGTSAWFTWTPKKKGLHHLYAVIQNTTGTTPWET